MDWFGIKQIYHQSIPLFHPCKHLYLHQYKHKQQDVIKKKNYIHAALKNILNKDIEKYKIIYIYLDIYVSNVLNVSGISGIIGIIGIIGILL